MLCFIDFPVFLLWSEFSYLKICPFSFKDLFCFILFYFISWPCDSLFAPIWYFWSSGFLITWLSISYLFLTCCCKVFRHLVNTCSVCLFLNKRFSLKRLSHLSIIFWKFGDSILFYEKVELDKQVFTKYSSTCTSDVNCCSSLHLWSEWRHSAPTWQQGCNNWTHCLHPLPLPSL